MNNKETKNSIGFGGGCHWCTEAVFSFLKGVDEVIQGFIASESPYDQFSEAVIVKFDPEIITLADLTAIHLNTHNADSDHSMRNKYRSAVYFFTEDSQNDLIIVLEKLQEDFEKKLVTKILPFKSFKSSAPEYQNYYFNNPQKPFCRTYINPKLNELMKKFGAKMDQEKLKLVQEKNISNLFTDAIET